MKNLTIVGLRLIAIWFFFKALSYIQFLPMYFTDQYQNFSTAGIGMLSVFLIYILAAGILFFKAPVFSSKISGNFDETSLQINNYQKFAAILFAAVGLLIFFHALESFINNIGSIFNDRAVNLQAPNRLISEISILLFGGAIQMIIGACLFIGAKKVANWWHDFRNWT